MSGTIIKFLVSNGNFSLGKNENVNSLEMPVMKSHKDSNFVAQTSVTRRDLEKQLPLVET